MYRRSFKVFTFTLTSEGNEFWKTFSLRSGTRRSGCTRSGVDREDRTRREEVSVTNWWYGKGVRELVWFEQGRSTGNLNEQRGRRLMSSKSRVEFTVEEFLWKK